MTYKTTAVNSSDSSTFDNVMLFEGINPFLGISSGRGLVDIETVEEQPAHVSQFEITSQQLVPQIERCRIEGNNGGHITGITTLEQYDILVGNMAYFEFGKNFHFVMELNNNNKEELERCNTSNSVTTKNALQAPEKQETV